MKDNEIAGTGNHTTAEFWEYDTRTGRRWNLDPVDQVNASNYSVLSGNPIWRTDQLGNTDNTYEVTAGKPGAKKIDNKGGDEVDHIISNVPESTNFGTTTPAHTEKYDVPVETATFGTGVMPYTAFRGPGQKVIGSITDKPIQSVCYECLFIPLPKGLNLLGKGLGITGRVAKADVGMATLGGASKYLNYYTNAARLAGYSMEQTVPRTSAGIFLNGARYLAGKSALYSSNAATLMGRSWANQAIGLGLFNVSVSVGAGIYNLSPPSEQQGSGGIGLSGGSSVPTIDNLSHR